MYMEIIGAHGREISCTTILTNKIFIAVVTRKKIKEFAKMKTNKMLQQNLRMSKTQPPDNYRHILLFFFFFCVRLLALINNSQYNYNTLTFV